VCFHQLYRDEPRTEQDKEPRSASQSRPGIGLENGEQSDACNEHIGENIMNEVRLHIALANEDGGHGPNAQRSRKSQPKHQEPEQHRRHRDEKSAHAAGQRQTEPGSKAELPGTQGHVGRPQLGERGEQQASSEK
jgi:hypothetical protein